MDGFKIYGKPGCVACEQSKSLLDGKGVGYEYVNIMGNKDAMEMFRQNGYKSVPQIFFAGEHIGGFQALVDRIEQLVS